MPSIIHYDIISEIQPNLGFGFGNNNSKNEDETKDKAFKNKDKDEIFRIFFAWTAAFFLMEPLVSLLVFNTERKRVTMLSLMTDYVYSSVTFLNAVYVYRHIFKKPEYFPRLIQDFPLFIAIYTFIQIVFDIIWLISTNNTHLSWNYPLKSLLMRYDKITKLSHSIHIVTYGLVWLNITFFFYNYVRPLDALATIIGSLFLMLLLNYEPIAKSS